MRTATSFEAGGFPNPSGGWNAAEFERAKQEFLKALTAGYGTDVAALTGGGALRLQSIDPILLASIETDDHFPFFNSAAQREAGATVDEYTVQTGIGGFPGSAFNGESASIQEQTGEYARKTLQIKYLMTKRSVSVVQREQRTIVASEAVEQLNGARELKRSAEWASFYGDSRVVPEQFDGLTKILEIDTADSKRIVDARGGGLDFNAREVLDIAAHVHGQGSFGRTSHVYCSPDVKNAEFDQKLNPAIRVNNNGQRQEVGTPVDGVKSSWGGIKVVDDVFIQEGQDPWQTRAGGFAALAAATGYPAPAVANPTRANSPATSKFGSEHAGSYAYAVASVGKRGESVATVAGATAPVVAADRVTLNITNPANANVTGFAVYRGRRNGTNAPADLRLVAVIPRVGAADGSSVTPFLDDNADIPGTSRVFVLNQTPGDHALTIVRLFGMMKFPLYPTDTATILWAQLMSAALRVAKPLQHGIIKNVLPRSAKWLPFN